MVKRATSASVGRVRNLSPIFGMFGPDFPDAAASLRCCFDPPRKSCQSPILSCCVSSFILAVATARNAFVCAIAILRTWLQNLHSVKWVVK